MSTRGRQVRSMADPDRLNWPVVQQMPLS